MPKLWEALLTLAILIAALAVGIIIFGVDPHVPMFVGVMAAAIMALHLGYKWDEVEKSMMDGIYKALQSICILIIVGILIGVWINAGVVPTMIYYGLKVLKPAIFFIACVLICSITSLATGTSWGTMGTMGVALMGIGFGLGMSPGMTAGAVLSGAYFGDKMSPLSDTTNLAPAMAGTDVITHVKAMMLPTGITYAITLIFFGVLGVMQYHGGDADMSRVIEFSNALNAAEGGIFNINPLLLLPPVVVIVAVALKVPAIPGITLGIVAGVILGLIFQPGACTLGTIFDYGKNGYKLPLPQPRPWWRQSFSRNELHHDKTAGKRRYHGYDVLCLHDDHRHDVRRYHGGDPPARGHRQRPQEVCQGPCGSRWPDRSDLRSFQRHHARAVHLHRGSRPYVCRGVSQDGRAPGSSVLCP